MTLGEKEEKFKSILGKKMSDVVDERLGVVDAVFLAVWKWKQKIYE